jgi:hypothetical protein
MTPKGRGKISKRRRRKRQERRWKHAELRGWQTRHSVITGATVSAGALLGISSTASAAVFQVDNKTDNGALTACTGAALDCSLRGAVTAANTGGDAIDNVTFKSDLSGQITLTGGELLVTDGTYILGPGAKVLTISGNNASRIFHTDPTTPGQPVGIYDLRLINGHPSSGNGGAVSNQDALLKIVGSVISGNTAPGTGGGVFDQGGSNQGYDDYIVDSTISGNSAGTGGGGLFGPNSLGTIVSSTISGNHANGAQAGGAYSYYGTVFDDSTIAGNTAATSAGGIFVNDKYTDTLSNSVVADNTATGGDPDVVGPFDTDFSLIEDTTGATIFNTVAASNITGTDPMLGSLQDNGGPTPTRLPATGSPVVDQGRGNTASDQRGQTRAFDFPAIANSAATGADGSDMGAVEVHPPPPPVTTPPTSTAPPAPVATKKKKKCKKKKHKRSAQVAKKKCKKKKKK